MADKIVKSKKKPCYRCSGVGFIQVHPIEIPCPVCNKKKVNK